MQNALPTIAPLKIALCGFAALAVAMGIGRFAFTPLLPMMHDQGLISIRDGGLLASVHFVGYLLGALFAGWAHKWPKLSLYGSLVLIALSTLAMAITGSYPIWIVSRWIAGFCSALVLVTVSTHFIKRLVELKRPALQNLVFAGVGGGILVIGLMAFQFLVINLGSELAWLTFGLLSLVTILIVYTQIGTRIFNNAEISQSSTESAAPLNWRLIIPYGATGVGYIIPATYLPVMAQSVVDSPSLYGLGWPIFGLAAALSMLLAARFQRHYSDRQIWIVCQVVMAVGLILPILYASLGVLVLGGVCVGGTFMVITMVGMREAHRVSRSGNPQRLIAALTAAFALGQIIGPALAGWSYEATGSFSAPLLLGSVLLVVSLVPLAKS